MKPKFSLIIPLAPDRKPEVINSIKKLNYPKSKYEVIVVKSNNASRNRNEGVMKSKGEFIVFLDDDATIQRNYLKNVEEFFDKHGEIDVVGGPQLSPLNETGFGRISGYVLASKFGSWKISQRYSLKSENLNANELMLTSANLICNKKVTSKIKFDEKLFPGEEVKFIEEAKRLNFRIAYSPEIIVYHRRRNNLFKFIKQIFGYGKTRPFAKPFLENINQISFFIPSFFIIYVLSIYFWVRMSSLFWIPLFTYFVLSLSFSVYESLKNKHLLAMFFLPFMFLFLHLSYGLGIIWGYMGKTLDFFMFHKK